MVVSDASEASRVMEGQTLEAANQVEKVIRARAASRASILAFQTSTMQMHARLMFFRAYDFRSRRYIQYIKISCH